MSEQYYKVNGQHLTDTANVIREKLTSEDTFKPSEFPEKISEVYDSGYSKAESDFWDRVQNKGERTFYEYGFYYWQGAEYIRPKYKVVPNSSSRNTQIFRHCENLKKLEAKYFDFSAFKPTEATGTSSNYYTVADCPALQEIEDIGIQAGGYYGTFAMCRQLENIAIMRCVKGGSYALPFNSCSALKNITIEGEIGKNFTIADSPLLTIESLRSIISALYDFVGNGETTTQTLTLHATAKARLTEDDIKTITDKGWTLV